MKKVLLAVGLLIGLTTISMAQTKPAKKEARKETAKSDTTTKKSHVHHKPMHKKEDKKS
jgi:hypothetical protein